MWRPDTVHTSWPTRRWILYRGARRSKYFTFSRIWETTVWYYVQIGQETVESSYFHSFLVSKAIIVINKTSEIFKRIPPSHKSLFSRQHLHAPPPRLLPRRGGLSAKREFTESLGRMKQSNVSCLSHVRQVSVYFTWIRRLTVATFL